MMYTSGIAAKALQANQSTKGLYMMEQFVIWQLRGVRYLCLRDDAGSGFVVTIKRL